MRWLLRFPEISSNLELDIRDRMPWRRQYLILFSRCWKEQQRRWLTSLTQLVQSMLIAVLIGGADILLVTHNSIPRGAADGQVTLLWCSVLAAVFFQIGTTQSSVAKRLPSLFFCCINQGVLGAMAVVNSFPAERILTLRERGGCSGLAGHDLQANWIDLEANKQHSQQAARCSHATCHMELQPFPICSPPNAAAGMYYVSAYFLAKSTAESLMYIVAPVCFSSIVYW